MEFGVRFAYWPSMSGDTDFAPYPSVKSVASCRAYVEMSSKKVVLHTTIDWNRTQDGILESPVAGGVRLLRVVGKDCERWHDVMDENIVGDGDESRDHSMITTWHVDESLQEAVEFARSFKIEGADQCSVEIIEI